MLFRPPEPEIITEEVTEPKLSDSCDLILAEGSWNDDYYELVYNSSTSVNDSNVYVGIIKNNKWLMEMNSDTLLASGKINNTDYYYLGEGCFGMYKYNSPDGYVEQFYIYNPENQFSLEKVQFPGFGTNTEISVVDGKFLAAVDFELSVVDVNKKTVKAVPGLVYQDYERCGRFSEELFFFNGNEKFKRGLYDENMNLKINLENYNVNKQECYFENGTCRFRASDSSRETFYFTIDKEGNILSKEPYKS